MGKTKEKITLQLNPHQAFLVHIWASHNFEWHMKRFFEAEDELDKKIAQDFMLDTLIINRRVTKTQPDLRITYRSLLRDFYNAVTRGEKPEWIR